MSTRKAVTSKVAIAALATILSVPAFAATRQNGDRQWNNDRGNDNTSRNEGRNDNDIRRGQDQHNYDRRSVNAEGRISSLTREGDGYRVRLEKRNESFFLPSSLWHGRRSSGLRVGLSIRLNGNYNNRGYYDVSSADWNYDNGNGYGYNDGYLRGVVERVDVRRGFAEVLDRESGRVVTVAMPNGRRGVDLNDLRRGDSVTLSGQWTRNGAFEAFNIDSVRSGRY